MNTFAAPTLAARLLKTGLGLSLMAAGIGGTAMLFIPYRRAMETRSWTETPCTITESRVEPRQRYGSIEWCVLLNYTYAWQGHDYTGHRWRMVSYFEAEDADISRKTPDRATAEALAAKYPAGSGQTCKVDPADPSRAVLDHHTLAPIYTLWWPLLFAAGGAGIVWSAWRRPASGAGNPSSCKAST